MDSSFARKRFYLVHAVTPGGDRVELGCNPCADSHEAIRLATRLGLKLAQPDEYPLGLPSAVEDVCESLGSLGADPLDCDVCVVTDAPACEAAPNGWWVAWSESVATYASREPAACVSSRR